MFNAFLQKLYINLDLNPVNPASSFYDMTVDKEMKVNCNAVRYRQLLLIETTTGTMGHKGNNDAYCLHINRNCNEKSCICNTYIVPCCTSDNLYVLAMWKSETIEVFRNSFWQPCLFCLIYPIFQIRILELFMF